MMPEPLPTPPPTGQLLKTLGLVVVAVAAVCAAVYWFAPPPAAPIDLRPDAETVLQDSINEGYVQYVEALKADMARDQQDQQTQDTARASAVKTRTLIRQLREKPATPRLGPNVPDSTLRRLERQLTNNTSAAGPRVR